MKLIRQIGELWSRLRQRLGGKSKEHLPDLTPLFEDIGIDPSDTKLYLLAMRHRSCTIAGEQGEKLNNERLEFL